MAWVKRICLLVTAVAVAVTTGCGGAGRPENTADIVGEATEFGGLVIPDRASVLGARVERGIDTLYWIAVSADQESVHRLLRESNFSTPLVKEFEVAERTVAGPPLDSSPSLLRAEDEYRGPGGKTVFRVIIVDERDQASRYVHIHLFDT